MNRILLIIIFIIPFHLSGQEELDGKTLFRNKCKACHNIDQRLVGPALKNIHEKRDSTWLFNFINGSQAMIEAGDTAAVALFSEYNQILMPNQNLSVPEFSSIMSYIRSESQPKAVSDNPIARPEPSPVAANIQLQFDNYFFWIPFTVFVILFIIVLYYMTFVTDMAQGVKE